MVSASKLRKAERNYREYNDFLNRIMDCISSVADSVSEKNEMITGREIKCIAYIIITSDRGLAGSYNSNIYKKITEEIDNNPFDYVIGAIGRKGFNYCHSKKYNLLSEAIYVRDDVEFHEIQGLAQQVIKMYKEGTVDKIVVVYNKYINTLVQETVSETVLPLGEVKKGSKKINYEYDQKNTLNKLIPMYVEDVLFGLIIEAKASEHAARMTAMKSATDNANEVIHQLQLLYNRARQASITGDLIDIIGGADAV